MDDPGARMNLEQLVALYHRGVYGYAFRLTGTVHDAEDLTQQVFLIAQQKLEDLRKMASARAWLFAILRSSFLKGCQKKRPVLADSVSLNLGTVPEHSPPDSGIDQERLQEVLNQLPEKYRLVVAMFYYEDCSYREIAEHLGLPIGTVMSRLARAKNQLRNRLLGLDAAVAAGPRG
jgi:RNA polymerase sigma-70 factor (ECF subfamily)